MACGNTGDEGESGATYNTLMIVDNYVGFDAASVDEESVNEKQILDFSFYFDLHSTYPLGIGC